MKTVILIAGLPASGKTSFALYLGEALHFPVLSKDRIKELLYDSVGFHSQEEKVAISVAGSQLLYYYAESLMRTEADFILETNFENVHKPPLLRLLEKYAYRSITVRFSGEYEAVYERYLQREQSEGRHPGHKTAKAYPPPGEGETFIGSSLSFEEFVRGVHTRGIADFSIGGQEFVVDSTHIEQLRYNDLVRQVRTALGGPLGE